MDATIAAIATAYGEGGIGIIRISGDKSEEILRKIFVSSFNIEHRKLTYGNIVDPENGEMIDEVLAVLMKAPHTYTREDVVEINCHGSVVSLRKTLDLVLRMGARLAEEGEFTKRAFLNGRLDLSQAEAVIDIIRAKTDKSFDIAMGQLEGKLSKTVSSLRKDLLDLLVNITVNIDYPDEDIEEVVYDDLEKSLVKVNGEIEKLISTGNAGKIINEGLRVSIIGKPNVGKSSLMNALLNEDRAIVTSIAGTTRDTIEEKLSIRSIPIVLTDTAGIRETEDQIEKIGIEKSKESFNTADLVIFVCDMSKELESEDLEIISHIGDRKVIVLANKIDLEPKLTVAEIKKHITNATVIETSMEDGRGIEEIKDEIESLIYGGEVKQNNSLIISNARHLELLRGTKSSLDDAVNMVRMFEALEFIEVDVKKAYELLGEIIGETVSDDIINEVFARFCLGK
ncbi:MAG: tRNA uridine-5-carboxymethylaminomethyl(34) synthesis GTPase MnmE [Eubacterium sp.]|nr:tRNA uridine-5-carboxymethylaminomethyl(34) synthesis GTPase MnmE [Eubacterium sp.]